MESSSKEGVDFIYFGKVLCNVCGKVVSEQTPEGKSEIPYFNMLLMPHVGSSEYDFSLDLCDTCTTDMIAGIEVLLETFQKRFK
jgi:hypothetical protein